MKTWFNPKSLFFLLVAVFFAFAYAQSIENPASWPEFWSTQAALAPLVLFVVGLLKKRIEVLDGFYVTLTSLGVGVLLGILGTVIGYLEATTLQGAIFGFAAGAIASGGWDTIMDGLLKLIGARGALAENSSTHTDAAHARRLTK